MLSYYLGKRKREQVLRLRYSRFSQTPNALQRVKAHAERREPSTLLLCIISIIGRFRITRFSGRFNVYLCLYLSQPIGIYGFKGLHIMFVVYLSAKILNYSKCAKEYWEKFRGEAMTVDRTRLSLNHSVRPVTIFK